MSEPRDGLEFLDQLRENEEKKENTFDDISWYLEQKAREKGVPIAGQFELTPLCNFDCKMCYVHLSGSQMGEHALLTTDQWKKLIHEAYENGMYKATLTGGECLTYPGFGEIYLYLHKLGCEVYVLTNGLLLDEKWVDFFKAHPPARIQITLYGHDDDSYERVTGRRAFDTVSRNIQLILEADLPLQIAITPNKYMGSDTMQTIKQAKSWTQSVQVNSGLFMPREETGRAEQNDNISDEDYIEIYRQMREMDGKTLREIPEDILPAPGGPYHSCEECGMQCGGGRSSFVIDWKGIMEPCNRMSHLIYASPLMVGFKESWKIINHAANDWPRVPECKECPYEAACSSNCAADVLAYGDPGKQPIGLCERTKNMVRHGIWRIADCEQ